jgi:hypothetical protein
MNIQIRVDQNGRTEEILESNPDCRRIKIKSIAPDRNLAEMATEIVDKCKYIHPTRAEEVEQLLIQLSKAAKKASAENANQNSNAGAGKSKERERERDTNDAGESNANTIDRGPPAKMDNLDDYLDMLYQVSGKSDNENDEGLKTQIQGTAMILKLCKQVVNLEVLIQNGTLMGALTRVLQEEFKKSVELTYNILR